MNWESIKLPWQTWNGECHHVIILINFTDAPCVIMITSETLCHRHLSYNSSIASFANTVVLPTPDQLLVTRTSQHTHPRKSCTPLCPLRCSHTGRCALPRDQWSAHTSASNRSVATQSTAGTMQVNNQINVAGDHMVMNCVRACVVLVIY